MAGDGGKTKKKAAAKKVKQQALMSAVGRRTATAAGTVPVMDGVDPNDARVRRSPVAFRHAASAAAPEPWGGRRRRRFRSGGGVVGGTRGFRGRAHAWTNVRAHA